MSVVRREVSDRTVMGKIFKYGFITFNILMLIFFLKGCAISSESISNAGVNSEYPDAAAAGATIGSGIAMGALLLFWVAGDVILGLFVLFTRRKKIVEVEE